MTVNRKGLSRKHLYEGLKVRKRHFFVHVLCKNDHFTKTGSGQT